MYVVRWWCGSDGTRHLALRDLYTTSPTHSYTQDYPLFFQIDCYFCLPVIMDAFVARYASSSEVLGTRRNGLLSEGADVLGCWDAAEEYALPKFALPQCDDVGEAG
jgi:hypothetical protein